MQRHQMRTMGLVLNLAFLAGAADAQEARQPAALGFYDRDRLAATALMNEQAAVTRATAQVTAAATAYEHARASLQTVRQKLAGLQPADPARADKQADAEALQKMLDGPLAQALAAAEAGLAAAKAALVLEERGVAALLPALNDGQVFAFNRALNNAVAAELAVRLNAAELQAAIEGAYDNRQINLLTRALEEEAKFLARADVFDAKAVESNDPHFLQTADRMRSRAAEQKAKYLSRMGPSKEAPQQVVPVSAADAAAPAPQGPVDANTALAQRMAAREVVQESRALARRAVLEARRKARESHPGAEDVRQTADTGVLHP